MRLELLGADGAERPVFLQDAEGQVVQEGFTDADGVFVVDRTTADAALTVELLPAPSGFGRGVRLVTYLGLSSDDVLQLDLSSEPERSETETATVTVTFDQFDDASVDHYSVDLGRSCGNSGPIEHDSSSPTHVVEIVAHCFGVPGRAVLVAEDRRGGYIAAAGAPLDLAPDEEHSITLGPWETDRFELRLTGELPADSLALVTGTWGGRAVVVDQERVEGGRELPIPAAPSAVDGVKIGVSVGLDGPGYVARLGLADVELSFADFPAPITELEVSELDERAAPRIAWRGGGETAAAIGHFRAYSADPELDRWVIRGGSPCHIDFPPLPERYDSIVPTAERELTGSVTLISGPAINTALARQRIGPLVELPVDTPFFTVHASESIDNYSPDPS